MPNKTKRHNKIVSEDVTLPVSDTVPGPGTFQARVLHTDDGEIPTIVGVERDNWIGAGTAQDVTSSLKAPVPGIEPPLQEDRL